MPLLREIKGKKYGLEGITEEGERVLLSAPNLLVEMHDATDGVNMWELLKDNARLDKDTYYQVGIPCMHTPNSTVAAIPYAKFSKLDSL